MPLTKPRSIVLVGLMGAGKTAIGKRLAVRLGLPYHDADHEIELAAGITINEIFARHGEQHFRAGEKRVIQRLLKGEPAVLALGGGAFMDRETRALAKQQAISIWLRCPLHVLIDRVKGRTHRPLLNGVDPGEMLRSLSAKRSPIYAQADIIVDATDGPLDWTTELVLKALSGYRPPHEIQVALSSRGYQVLVGDDLVKHAGRYIAPILAQPRCLILTDKNVAELYLHDLVRSLDEVRVVHNTIIVAPGEASKSLETWAQVVDQFLSSKADRHTTVLALGGGVIGDLAGFAASTALRGMPLIQIPTTLLAQVDSSVGGKTGLNSRQGKNLIGTFHQPLLVLADTSVLSTLPPRELRAGYAEIVKAAVIADETFFQWCETNGKSLLEGNSAIQAKAIEHAVKFKAAVVADDEREEKRAGGRALLNLGHTFAHAFEAETGYSNELLHGEAVAMGIVLAARLSSLLGFCSAEEAVRIASHFSSVGLPTSINHLDAERLISHMQRDKKMREGKLTFVLMHGIGHAFTCPIVPEAALKETLIHSGAV